MLHMRALSLLVFLLPASLHAATLSDLVGGVLPGGDVLYSNFTVDSFTPTEGIDVGIIDEGDTVGLRFSIFAFSNNAEYFASGGYDINVFDPSRRIVSTSLTIVSSVDERSFDPQVRVETSVLEARDNRFSPETFDSAPITETGPFSETWFAAVTDSGSVEGGAGAALDFFEVRYTLGDRFPVTEVPLPASGWLLACALGGLAVRRRARRQFTT